MKNEKPVRILHYIGSLNVGGSQAMIMELYRKIDKSKVQFDFVVDRTGEYFFSDEVKKMGGKIYELKYFKGYNIYQFKKQWEDFFKEHVDYKVIHCHVRSVASIVLKIAKKYNLKTICHSHSTSNGTGFKSLIKKLLQSRIVKFADYLFACSEDSAKWLYGNDVIKYDNCFIINNAIDAEKFSYDKVIRDKVRNDYNLENNIVIGQVGRIETMKNHIFSLKILKECLKKDKSYVLMIVGDGSLRDYIEAEARNLGVFDNVLFLGNRRDVNDLMQAMDIFLMPSIFEGLPLVLVEAQAASLPCIISDNISAGFFVDDLIEKVSLNAPIDVWINKIIQFHDNKRIDRKEEIIKNKFDIKENAKLLEDFYLNI